MWHGQVRSARSAGSLHPGFSSPCTFVAAASGANGTILWERPAAQNGALVECTGPQPRGGEAPAACILLGRPGPFIAVNLVTGRLRPEVGALGLCTRSDARMLRGGSTRGSGSKTRQEERLGGGGECLGRHLLWLGPQGMPSWGPLWGGGWGAQRGRTWLPPWGPWQRPGSPEGCGLRLRNWVPWCCI